MEAFASATPPPQRSPSPKPRRPHPSFLRCERWVCNVVKYFPLAFVYGLTTWAVWVEATIGLKYSKSTLFGRPLATLGIVFYLLLNACYTVAVFVDPGSPLDGSRGRHRGRWRPGGGRHEYSHLPTTEEQAPQQQDQYSSLTVSSTGGARHCKKCQAPKPDRAHHCSSCNRCVLKMDHHCPWLATCVGLHNYKPFLLFLIYTSLFCWVCVPIAARWIWNEMLTNIDVEERSLPINAVMLAVIALVIGLVLTGFTAWHASLAVRGLTTIESLEKTRYLSPIRKTLDRQRQGQQHQGGRASPHRTAGSASSWNEGAVGGGGFRQTMQGYGQQFLDMHANAIPGVTRAEEGEERSSPSPDDQHRRRTPPSSRSPQPPPPSQQQQQQQPPLPPPSGYDPNEHFDNYNTPAQQSLYHSYEELERARAQDRYEEYLDERDSESLPNAFDLGWRRNLAHLFGPSWLFWLLPVCNTTGDGWRWDANPQWVEAKQHLDAQRVQRWELGQRNRQDLQSRYQHQYQHQHQQNARHHPSYDGGGGGGGTAPRSIVTWGRSYHDRADGADDDRPPTGVSMQTLAPMSPRPRPGEMELDDEDYDGGGNDGGDWTGRQREDNEWRDWE